MRRIFSWILIIALSLGLCACGHNVETQWQEQYDLGVRCLSDGNYEEAIIVFTAAIEIDPKQASAYVGRGNAYIGKGETEENLAAALADYQSALELDDACVDAYLGLADVYIRSGDFDKAQAILETGVEKTGDQLISVKLEAMEEGAFKDSNGNVRKSVTLDSEGNLLFYHTFDYDAAGRKQLAVSYNSNGAETSCVEYVYDLSGNLTNGDGGYNANTGEFHTARYFYDGDGRLTREDLYRNDGTLWCYHTWEYNSAGQQIRWNEFFDSGELGCYFLYDYDQENHRVRSTYYDAADNEAKYYYTYEYDNHGYKTKSSMYDEQGALTQYTVYNRDENGFILSADTYDASDALIRTANYG